jgi:hypothetical protein
VGRVSGIGGGSSRIPGTTTNLNHKKQIKLISDNDEDQRTDRSTDRLYGTRFSNDRRGQASERGQNYDYIDDNEEFENIENQIINDQYNEDPPMGNGIVGSPQEEFENI